MTIWKYQFVVLLFCSIGFSEISNLWVHSTRLKLNRYWIDHLNIPIITNYMFFLLWLYLTSSPIHMSFHCITIQYCRIVFFISCFSKVKGEKGYIKPLHYVKGKAQITITKRDMLHDFTKSSNLHLLKI